MSLSRGLYSVCVCVCVCVLVGIERSVYLRCSLGHVYIMFLSLLGLVTHWQRMKDSSCAEAATGASGYLSSLLTAASVQRGRF